MDVHGERLERLVWLMRNTRVFLWSWGMRWVCFVNEAGRVLGD